MPMTLHQTASPARVAGSQISPQHELPEASTSPKQSNSTSSLQAYEVKLSATLPVFQVPHSSASHNDLCSLLNSEYLVPLSAGGDIQAYHSSTCVGKSAE